MMEARFLEPYTSVLEQAVLDLSVCSLRGCSVQSGEPFQQIVPKEQNSWHFQTVQVTSPLLQSATDKQSIHRDLGFGSAMQSMLAALQLGKIGNLAALFADPLLLVRMMFRFFVACFWRRILASQEFGKIGNLAVLFADLLLLIRMMIRFFVAFFWRCSRVSDVCS